MANIKSQKKRNITNAKAHDRNKAVRSELKSRLKAAESGDEDAVRLAVKTIDTAPAQKGVIPQERCRSQEEPPGQEVQRKRLTPAGQLNQISF